MGQVRRPHRILVLGAGYAGLTCHLELQDRVPPEVSVTLVNGDRFHWFTTELHTYVAGEPEDTVRIPLARVISPPGRLVVGRVERVATGARTVELAGGESLGYDTLVFGLGSDPEYFNLPGIEANSLVVGNWQGAARVRERVQALLDSGAATRRIVIAGGGLTGVEVAGELADEHGDRLALTILEAGPQIMAGFAPELVAVSRRVLEAKGIEVRTGDPITRVEPDRVHLKSGEALDCDLLVWAGGVRGSGVLAASGLETTPKGRAIVDAGLRALGHPEIYVVGDSAAFTDPETGREVPPTAQAAVQMGRTAARNILLTLDAKRPEPFVPQIRGAFASLGKAEGVGQMGAEQFRGLPAMLVKHAIEAHHAWESGAGVMPLVRRLLREPGRLLLGRSVRGGSRVGRVGRVGPAPPAARPEPHA